jgi:hypothetical protein
VTTHEQMDESKWTGAQLGATGSHRHSSSSERAVGAVAKTLLTSPSTSLTKPANASMRQALADRLTLSEAIETVGKMIRGYANAGQAGRSYIGAIAELLARYPRSVALGAADLATGVPSETRFLPTPADVVAWCERETSAMRKVIEVEDRDAMIERQRQLRAEDAAAWEAKRKDRPNYDELKAKYGPTWGLSAQTEEDTAVRDSRMRQLAEANERALLAEYEAADLEPKRTRDGTLISFSLLRLLGARAA